MKFVLNLLITFSLFLVIFIKFTGYALAATYTVTKTANTSDGTCNADCSFMEALTAANANSGADTINFNIPTSDGGYIAPSGSVQGYFVLPLAAVDITDNSGLFIDGYSQPGSSRNTAAFGQTLNTVLKIQINYSNASVFTLSGDNNHIAGLSLGSVDIHTVDASIDGSNSNWIEGNFFGSDITGSIPRNGGSFLITNGSSSNTFGTNGDGSGDVGERNLFMGNLGKDYAITGYVWSDNSLAAGDSNIIAGNYFGVNSTGRACANADIYGQVVALASSSNRIGTNYDGVSDSEEANIVGCINKLQSSDNPRGFIRLFRGSNNLIQGNFVGVSPYGDLLGTLVGTEKGAISLLAGSSNGNLIKGNTISGADFGILQSFSGRNTFSQNKIYGHTLLGIGLGSSTSLIPNDSGDLDSGVNDLMNYPEIQQAEYLGGGNYHLHGRLDGNVSEGPFTVEICLASSDPSDRGGCSQYLGDINLSLPGTWDFSVKLNGDDEQHLSTFIAIAKNNSGSTSEFGLTLKGSPRIISSTYSAPSPDALAEKGGVAQHGDVISIVHPNTFQYDVYLDLLITPQTGTYLIPKTQYWQTSPVYDLRWRSFVNQALVLSSEIKKSFIFAFHYRPSAIPPHLSEKNLKLAYSTDGQKWRLLNSSVLDRVNQTVSVVTKSSGYYLLVTTADTKNSRSSQIVKLPKSTDNILTTSNTDNPARVMSQPSPPTVKKHCFWFICF